MGKSLLPSALDKYLGIDKYITNLTREVLPSNGKELKIKDVCFVKEVNKIRHFIHPAKEKFDTI